MSLLTKINSIIVSVAVLLLPLFFLPTTPEFFITNKFYLLAYVVLICLLILTIKLVQTKKIQFINSPFNKPLLLLIIATLLSVIIVSPNKYSALFVIPTGLATIIILALFYYLLVNQRQFIEKPFKIFELLMIPAFILAVLKIIYFLNLSTSIKLPIQWQFLTNRSFTPIGTQFELFVILGFFALFSLFNLYHQITNKEKSGGKSIATNILVAAIIIVATITTTMPLVKQMKIISSVAGQNTNQQTINLSPWNISWYAAVETLKTPKTALFGIGVDNYLSIFTQVKPISYNLSSDWQLNYNLSRSTLLHIWAEAGLLGLVAMLLLILFALREIIWINSKNYQHKTVITVLFGYSLLILLLFPPQFISFLLFFVTLAVIELVGYHIEKSASKHKIYDLTTLAPFAYFICLVSAAAIIGVSWVLGQNYLAEYNFKNGLNAISENKAKDVYESQQSAMKFNPYQETYRRSFSQINLVIANGLAQKKDLTDNDRQRIALLIQQSIASAKVAVQLNPQKVINWYNLAYIYRNIINIAQNAPNWTVAAYQQAIRRDPNNPLLRLELGGIFYGQKNYNQAAQIFNEATNLKPNWANGYYNLAWALYQNKNYADAYLAINRVSQLIDQSSSDYKKIQDELAKFKESVPTDQSATGDAKLKDIPATTQQPPLALPSPEKPVITPKLLLPDTSGPDATGEAR